MATAAPEDNSSDIFNCTICLERFTKPKYLPCLHTFCEACLNTYILSTQTGENKPGYFSCPVCRQEVKSPDPDAPVNEWAKLIPINHMIYSLMESSFIGKEKDVKCSPCERNGEKSTSTFWCIDCQESFCDLCEKFHNRLKISATHKTVQQSELENTGAVIHIPDIEEPCPVHKGEVLKVYCEDHKEMCCVICLSINHRRCDDIKTFDQMAESMKKEKDHVQLAEKLKEIVTSVESLMVQKQQNIDNIEKQEQNLLEKAVDQIEQAKKNLDKCLEDFKTKFSQVHKEERTNLTDAKDRMEIFQKTVLNCEKMLKTVFEYGSSKQIFITSEKIKHQLKIQLDALKKFLTDDQEIEYKVDMDGKLAEITKMAPLAEIQVMTKPLDAGLYFFDTDVLFGPQNGDIQLHQKLRKASIADLEAVKLWDVTDGSWFTGGTFLDDGRLLCADYTRKTFDVFDQDGHKQISLSLKYEPWDVAQHSDGRMFATDRTENCIRVYSLSKETLTEIKSIQLQSSPYGISILNEYILAVVGDKVNTMTLEGNGIKTVSDSVTNIYITSRTGNQESNFYYCNGYNVVCKTAYGTEVHRHSLPKIKGARGIEVDFVGNVYVCGMDSGNVFVISKDFNSDQVFMSNLDVIKKPYAIKFDKHGTKFFISSYNNGTFAVYKLQTRQ